MEEQIKKLTADIAVVENDAAELLKNKQLDACPHMGSLRARLTGALEAAQNVETWLANNPVVK